MSNQVELPVEKRTETGKGVARRLRRDGRVPGIVYGYEIEPTPVSIETLALYHALRTEAGANVLLRLEIDGVTHLAVARDRQMHPVRGETLHVDLLAVDKDSPIAVEVPIHLVDEDDLVSDGGVLNQVMYTLPIEVRPMDVPNYLELSVAGMSIGDVRRAEDLASQLAEGAVLDADPEATVVTINAPITEAEMEAMEEGAGLEADEPTLVGEVADERPAEDE